MLSALLLVALVSQSPSGPDIRVMFQKSDDVVLVYPPEGRAIQSVIVQLPRTREGAAKELKPLERFALRRNGVMAVFDGIPFGSFDVLVTLDDGFQHRRRQVKLRKLKGVYTVGPYRGDPPREWRRDESRPR